MYNHLTLQMYDLTLTASVAKSATWGKPMNPRGINRGAVADSAAMANSRFSVDMAIGEGNQFSRMFGTMEYL